MNTFGGRLVHIFAPVPPEDPVRYELVAGEETSVAGLVVVPELTENGRGFTGAWRVAHELTGRPVSPPYATVREALAAARRLGDVPLARWDRRGFAPEGQEVEFAEMVHRALEPPLALAAG